MAKGTAKPARQKKQTEKPSEAIQGEDAAKSAVAGAAGTPAKAKGTPAKAKGRPAKPAKAKSTGSRARPKAAGTTSARAAAKTAGATSAGAGAAAKPAKPKPAKPSKPKLANPAAPASGAGPELVEGASAAPIKPPSKPRRPPRAKVVEDTARSYFGAIAGGDLDAIASHWHPDGVEDLVPVGIFRGPGAVRKLFGEMFAAMPDLRMTADRITAGSDGAAVQWRLWGTFDGEPFQGIRPTRRRVELRGTDCLEIDTDGKITRNTVYFDGAAFARAIGMLPPQDGPAERAMRRGFNLITRLRSRARRPA